MVSGNEGRPEKAQDVQREQLPCPASAQVIPVLIELFEQIAEDAFLEFIRAKPLKE